MKSPFWLNRFLASNELHDFICVSETLFERAKKQSKRALRMGYHNLNEEDKLRDELKNKYTN